MPRSTHVNMRRVRPALKKNRKIEKKKEFCFDSDDFGFNSAGVSSVVIKETPDIISNVSYKTAAIQAPPGCVGTREEKLGYGRQDMLGHGRIRWDTAGKIRWDTGGYVGIRQHTLGHGSRCWDTVGYFGIRQDTLGHGRIRWDTAGYVGTR